MLGSIGLSVCLSVCGQHYSNIYEWIGMKFYGLGFGGGGGGGGAVLGSTTTN